MSHDDALELLRKACEETSQAQVAKAVGYSPTAINQVLKGTYPSHPEALLRRIVEVYGNDKVNCPVLGEIPLGRCAEERKNKGLHNPLRVELFRACGECEEWR